MSENNERPAEKLVRGLKEKGLRITAAESCTGGLRMSEITSVSGASDVFSGGFVTYSEETKHKYIGVSKKVIEKYGVVSIQTACEMAEGALETAKADIALAVTGWAGPNDGDDGQPHGTVCIGLAAKGKVYAKKYRFEGDRNSVRAQAAEKAIETAIIELGII